MFDGLTDRQRTLVNAVLVLAVIALGFIVAGYVANVFYAFFDIIVLFFLAWLLSFALLPLINGLTRLVPRLTQVGAVVIVYLTIVVVLLAILVQASAALASRRCRAPSRVARSTSFSPDASRSASARRSSGLARKVAAIQSGRAGKAARKRSCCFWNSSPFCFSRARG